MDADAATLLIFTVASLVIAVVLTALALGPLRDRGEAAPDEHEGEGLPAPFAPDANSPLGATDQLSDERSAAQTRSARPGEARG